MEDSRERLEEIASAVEDLVHMGAISIDKDSRGRLSSRMTEILANLIADSGSQPGSEADRTMNLTYHALMIFINEELGLPRTFTLALAGDLEKHRDDMLTGALVSTYVRILAEISSEPKTTQG